jgi:hypothetical protein
VCTHDIPRSDFIQRPNVLPPNDSGKMQEQKIEVKNQNSSLMPSVQ